MQGNSLFRWASNTRKFMPHFMGSTTMFNQKKTSRIELDIGVTHECETLGHKLEHIKMRHFTCKIKWNCLYLICSKLFCNQGYPSSVVPPIGLDSNHARQGTNKTYVTFQRAQMCISSRPDWSLLCFCILQGGMPICEGNTLWPSYS